MVTKKSRKASVASREAPRLRDRLATRERVLEAVGRLLARDGFASLGVNAVAREAGVDKVLIYRYFGGLEALLEAWGRTNTLGAGSVDDAGAGRAGRSVEEKAAAFLAKYVRDLRASPEALEVMRWELVEDNPLTRRLAQVREEAGFAELRDLGVPQGQAEELDLPAVAAVLTAGLLQLALRAKSAPEWLGVPLRSDEGWARIEHAAVALAQAALRRTKP